MLDILYDIFSSLGKNKLRTFLTGFSMAWGVFMLILLLGCGNGLKNAVTLNFEDRAKNILTMWPGRTAKPYEGLKTDRYIELNDKAVSIIRELPEVGIIAPVRQVYNTTKTYGAEYVQSGLTGVTPDRFKLMKMDIVEGRLLNSMDMAQKRKVILMHKKNARNLFKDKEVIGRYVNINNVPYKVVGVFTDSNDSQSPNDFIPLSTLDMIYPTDYGYSSLTIEINGINSVNACNKFEKTLREKLSEKLQFDSEDTSAVWIWNSMSDYMQTMNIFNGISMFLWLIGLGTLIAGVVGISNIMLVTVKERTKEFGIRKSLGARPGNIIRLILSESLVITASFGYFGLLAGILIIEGLAKLFPTPSPDVAETSPSAFVNPEISIWIALGAMVVLIVAGLAAAYVPAKKAVAVKPIEALHYE